MIQLTAGLNHVTILPERGAIVSAWRYDGRRIFYEDEAVKTVRIIRAGMPVLFPLCGDLPGERYQFHETEYNMNRHGFARDLAWNVCAESESEVTLQLTETADTLALYPFSFCCTICYSLTEEGLTVTFKVRNDSEMFMPYQIGFHPYFATKNKTLVSSAIDWSQEVTEVNTLNNQLLEVQLDHLHIGLHDLTGFTHFVTWSLPDKHFICVEPWLGTPGMLGTPNCPSIAPKETRTHSFRLVVTK